MHFRLANITDIPQILDLVNISYRSKTVRGWTSESEIIDGLRLNESHATTLILKEDSFLILALEQNELIGCVHIEYNVNLAYLGLLTIHPNFQNKGLGKILLTHAENFCANYNNITHIEMSVLSLRKELLNFYQRRGYLLTNKIENYPLHANVGVPKDSNIKVLYLKKALKK